MQKINFSNLPSLNALRAFESAARLSSFTLAARELNVTPGAVSRQVKQLESDLQVSLFHRHNRSLVLTDQGMQLLSPLTMAFDMMTGAVKKLKQLQQNLNLKVHPTFAIRWLIPRFHKFQSLYPDIRVRLTIVGINVDFSRENFDVAITYMGKDKPGVYRKKILEESLIPVCSPKLLKQGHPLEKIEDLKHHTLLHNNPDLREWQTWASQMGVHLGFERAQVFEVDDAAIQAANAGLGVALGDSFLIRDELISGRLVAPLGYKPAKTGFYYFSRPKFKEKSQAIKALQEWIVNEIDQELSQDPGKNNKRLQLDLTNPGELSD